MGIIILILQVILGLFFIMTGVKIFSGEMKQEFARFGYPSIFNKITGAFEFIGAIAMLIGIFYSPLALFASALIGLTMLAGALSHILLGKDPVTKQCQRLYYFY